MFIKLGQLVLKGFRILSTTYDSIIVSWEVYPNDNTILTLNVTDSQQTVNKTINVAEYNNVYTYNGEILMCNVYTFKLILPKEKTGCNENIKVISTGTGNKLLVIVISLPYSIDIKT